MAYGKGPFAVDWEERYDFPALRRKRIEAVTRELRTSDLDALLLWPLLPQPASATSRRQTRIEPARDFVERLMQCSPWLEVTGHDADPHQ